MPRVRLRARGRPHCPLCRVAFVAGEPAFACPGCATRYHDDCAGELGGCSTLGCPRLGVGPEADAPLDQRWRARARRYAEGARARRASGRRLRAEHVARVESSAAHEGLAVTAEVVLGAGQVAGGCLDCLSLLAIFSVLAAVGLAAW